MDVPPLLRRPYDAPSLSHDGSVLLNANLGAGEQTNNTLNGGSHNRQFNANVITYKEQRRAETPPIPTHNVPFLRDPLFVHRSELDDVQQKIADPGCSRVALVGLGGVGKSQLAIEHCYRLRASSPETWVLWIHASSAARFDQDIRNIANDAKIPRRDDQDADIFELVRGWLSDSRKKWLIVLDNADEVDYLFATPSTTGDSGSARGNPIGRPRLACLPICTHGSILITTRSRAVASRMTDPHSIIHLDASEAHATSLLKKKLMREEDDACVASLAAALEHMPLAVSQAAAYINKRLPRCSIQAYLLKFERSEEAKSSLLSSSLKELRRDAEAKDSILLTWQISFEHIYALRQRAADLLSLMSFFDHQGIPEFLAKFDVSSDASAWQSDGGNERHDEESADTEDEAFEDDIDILRDYAFISVVSEAASSFEMHRLVQLAAQMWLHEKGHYQQWEREALRRLNNAFSCIAEARRPKGRALYPHARLVLNKEVQGRDASLYLASVLYHAAWYAKTQGLFVEAEAAARRSMNVRECILTEADSQTLDSAHVLANILQHQAKYEAAEEMDRFALAGRERLLGREHIATLMSVTNLMLLYYHQGKYEAAEEMSRRALEGLEKLLGREHSYTLVSVSNLAVILLYQAKHEEGEGLIRRALQHCERMLGPEHQDTLIPVANLAVVLQGLERYEAAEKMARRATVGYERMLGQGHPETLQSASQLATVLMLQHKCEEAEKINRYVLEGRKKVLGVDHPDTLKALDNLARVVHSLGDYEAAEAMKRRVLERYEEMLGKDHPLTLTAVSSISLTTLALGRLQEVECLLARCVEARTRVLGANHPDTERSLYDLASIRSLIAEKAELGESQDEME